MVFLKIFFKHSSLLYASLYKVKQNGLTLGREKLSECETKWIDFWTPKTIKIPSRRKEREKEKASFKRNMYLFF